VGVARDHALAQGAERILVISSDLPLVTADEIRLVRDRARDDLAAVICRDRHGKGTNAIMLTRPRDFEFAFGAASAAAHCAEAERLGLAPVMMDLAGIGFDIDTPADLEALDAIACARTEEE
jgi:2-phospho-L-lactate guanylyltransferase